MIEDIKKDLINKIGDKKLVENFLYSYDEISKEFVSRDPIGLLQNVGLFIESTFRIIEHIIFKQHTPLISSLSIENLIKKLEKAKGAEGLRIHAARLSRAVYDFRSRKKSVHLKEVDPQEIDANLVFNIATWIFIEILKELKVKEAESAIKLLFTRKIPLVQEVDGILRTTNPNLLGTERILLLLYSKSLGLTEEELLEGTKRKIKNKNHLRINLNNLDTKDMVHHKKDGRWILFGNGFSKAEEIIRKFSEF
ncbi:MAG: hypothetical protein DDT18_01034 [Actinobacteria bacterium]|nr:hypothetical protein [Actinomycetota bacterium]